MDVGERADDVIELDLERITGRGGRFIGGTVLRMNAFFVFSTRGMP